MQVREHPRFQRSGPHLVVQCNLSLFEALTGFSTAVPVISGGEVEMSGPKGAVVKPGEVWVIKGEGLPDVARGPLHLFIIPLRRLLNGCSVQVALAATYLCSSH